MLITKTQPEGIDTQIQKLQSFLHDRLIAKWGINTADAMFYGRVYRNKKEKGYVAEWYTGPDYTEAYYDDTKAAVCFFGLDNREEISTGSAIGVHLVFFVNLDRLKPGLAHRGDEEVRRDVLSVIGKGMFGLTLESVDLWKERCLREYPGTLTDAAVDMHPAHCFRLNFTANYTKNIC